MDGLRLYYFRSNQSDAFVATRAAAPGKEHPPLYGDGRASERIADLLCTMSRDER